MTDTPDGIPDFTGRLEPIKFRMHDHVFEATPSIPARVAFKLMDLGKGLGSNELDGDEQFDRLAEFFTSTLLPDSAAMFTEWMDSAEHPIGLGQAIKLMEWLMGEWGLSPTELSSPSGTTPDETGHISVVGVLPTV